MRILIQISLCCVLAGSALAQRHGGGGFGGGMRGGGMGGGMRGGTMGGGTMGGGMRGGGMGGGVRGGFGGGINRGGIVGGTFRNPGLHPGYGAGFYNRGYGYGYRGYGFGYGYGSLFYPYYGLGFSLGYWPDYWDYGYSYPYGYYGGYNPYGYGYASYQTSPNVTVVYPSQAPVTTVAAATERARPVTREYDQYGQEIRPPASGTGSPLYLIAFKDQSIRAAAAYWVTGQTLHYVTIEHEEKQAALDTVDRALSLQLNRERQVPFQLPGQ